jgi:hypothetical protein
VKCQNLRRKWIKREEKKTLLICNRVKSLGKRKEKGKRRGEKKEIVDKDNHSN